jgi:FAD/FMN-containing dehydrogenase/Fe-S oxidoreductase
VHARSAIKDARLKRFIQALEAGGFEGDIDTGFATREVLATDNSVYRIPPLAVIFPRLPADVEIAVRALDQSGPQPLSLTARGGGTGTNGQSLNDGIILDTTRYLTSIIEFDAEAGIVRVEPGVVLDQLNAFLAPQGWFFPPSVSTSNRATIGGMVATDASGKGSRQYGRTSDYIVAMDVVLADGASATFAPLDAVEARQGAERDERASIIARKTKEMLEAVQDHFPTVFPAMNRGLTGYNLKEALSADGGVNLCKILAGSEGTLAITTAVTLRLRPKPNSSGLMVLFYSSFDRALTHVPRLVDANPLAVEILDDKILGLAKRDPVWAELGALFGELYDTVGAVNFVEVIGDSDEEVGAKLAALEAHLEGDETAFLRRSVTEPRAIKAAWALRAKSVGLLGALEGKRKAYPFVEDTAVPPENLAAYIGEFRALLDRHGLAYGMFGHADVGCLHVRPTLDMTNAADRALIRTISDSVHRLTRAYGGLIWGEHGRGVRGEYLEDVFGPDLYPVVKRIKALFDPYNRFNPGKLAAPAGVEDGLLRIDDVPFRGEMDETIPANRRPMVQRAIDCNGNGACHDWDPADPMCPSYKVSRDKTQSPNGRAALLRAWARTADPETEAALKTSLDTCLSCRACASACPVKIDIPTMKSAFLETYFTRHRRPMRDHVIRLMEPAVLTARRFARLSNAVLDSGFAKRVLAAFGLVDLPGFCDHSLERRLRDEGVAMLDLSRPPIEAGSVIIVPDSFLASFDTEPLIASAKMLSLLGFKPVVAPVLANGKALEVRGFGHAYARTSRDLQRTLRLYAALGWPLVAIEPATTIDARRHGANFLLPIDVFLERQLAKDGAIGLIRDSAKLFLHCTEATSDPKAGGRWKKIFAHFGIEVDVVSAGCCGMSGLFGHEVEHRETSRAIFALSWAEPIAQDGAMATGFSCRCQTKRFGRKRVPHPLEVLVRHLAGQGRDGGTWQNG